MGVSRIRLAALALTSGIVLSGCAYDMYGDPYGYGYGPRSNVSIGVGYLSALVQLHFQQRARGVELGARYASHHVLGLYS